MARTNLKVIEPVAKQVRMCGTLTVLQRLNQYEFAVEIRMMREGINRNRWDYRNLNEYYSTFVGQPILCAYVNGKIGDGHNMREKTDKVSGERYYSFTDATSERIVGSLSNDIDDFTVATIDGETWLVAKGRLWEFYAPELVQKIIRSGRMDVSVETMVEDSYQDGEIEVFTKWTGIGVTILGDDVQPAIPNASIKALELMQDEFKKAKLQAASYESEHDTSEQKAEQAEQKTQSKGDKQQMKVLSKKELKNLQSTYFADFKVLSASYDKDKAETLVCMMKNGTMYQYIKADNESTIQPERIKAVSVNASVAFDENRELALDADEMIESVASEHARLEERCAELEKSEKKANDELNAMRNSEQKRRKSAAKKAAKATLDAYNLNSKVKVSESILKALEEAIDNGEYSECEDENGEWCGEEAVAEKVLAECAKQTQKANDELAAKEQSKVIWKTDAEDRSRESLSGIESLLALNNIPNE